MTVPQACADLAAYIQEQIDAGLENKTIYLKDVFPESQDVAFVEQLLTDLKAVIGNPDLTASEFIGAQEALAFLGNLQRIDAIRKTTRIGRRAAALEHKDNMADTSEGALALQLASIGSKVDSEYVAALV